MKPPRLWKITRESVDAFLKDDAMSLAAAVAFYTSLSFAPLVQLLITLGGFLGETTKGDLVSFLNRQIGPRAGEVTEAVVESAAAQEAHEGPGRWILSVGLLLFSASAVFGQLQHSLNRVWGAEAKPSKNWWGWLRRRLLSLGMVLVILFILLIALMLSALMNAFVPSESVAAARLGGEFVSFVVATLLFAAMFKVLPDVEVTWRDVWLGAAITAALFLLGKLVLSVYMEKAGVGKEYGNAAGALIALLVWVFYSCCIFLFGAEVTQVALRVRGGGRPLNEVAQPISTEPAKEKPVVPATTG